MVHREASARPGHSAAAMALEAVAEEVSEEGVEGSEAADVAARVPWAARRS